METAIINGICRCCASEGAFKDIRSAYQWMGAEEIYADMLKECFDLSLWSSGEGDDGGICEVCVTQLRNASNFKKQVLHTEEQFKKHLHTRLFKPSIVKVELPANDGIDSDDNISAEEGYSGTDYEVSAIKVESPEESKPKKRSAKMSTRASTSRAKKAKGDAGESSTKRAHPYARIENTVSKKVNSVERNKLLQNFKIYEVEKHRHNIRQILQYSNATPIRRYIGIGYACCFCGNEYPEPADLKKHTREDHKEKSIMKFMHGQRMTSYLVKLDITQLKCNLCNTNIDNLERLIEHLTNTHQKKFFTDIKNHIVPFKFDAEFLRCLYCDNVFNKFKHFVQHMNKHVRNYICDYCDAGFVNKQTIMCHIETHQTGTFKCSLCPKVFDTLQKQKIHEKVVHIRGNSVRRCPYCPQRFSRYNHRDDHMVKMHGVQLKKIKCHACDKTFDNMNRLRIHTKRDHLMERKHKCTECEMKFFTLFQLKNHMVKHTGVKPFQCDICLKFYGKKHTLKEHMRIHNNDRRFKCEHCGQTFVQKCSWKGHMRNRHGELV